MKKFLNLLFVILISVNVITAKDDFLKFELGDQSFYVYKAEKGESEYGICKRFSWDDNTFKKYNGNITSPFESGDLIYYPVAQEKKDIDDNAEEDEVIDHTIKAGETLYGLSQKYNTTVADLMRMNPGVSENNFKTGKKIKVKRNSRNDNLIRESRTIQEILGFNQHKVKKNESWYDIASKNGIPEEMLKAANPDIQVLEKNIIIGIPIVESKQVEVEIPIVDPRESSLQGRAEIYQEVKEEIESNIKSNNVRIALLFDNIDSNKDTEFLRGFVAGVNDYKDSGFKINLTGIDLKESEIDILKQLNTFEPDIIFTTSEKDVPLYLRDYAKENICYLANVFDVKSDDYLSNPMIIQLLTPSQYFNNEIVEYLNKKFSNYQILVVGEAEENDSLLETIFKYFDPTNVKSIDLDTLSDYDSTDVDNILIYGVATKKQDVKDLLEKIALLKEKSPLTEIVTLGRPNWITVIDSFTDEMSQVDTYIPSRFYFDAGTIESKKFIDKFKDLYDHTPMKSYPVYSVSGYDSARFFINAMHQTGGNMSKTSGIESVETLQNIFNLIRPENRSGYYNSAVYLLHPNYFGEIEKIELK